MRKSFWALIVTQFFGAFNDNLFKLLVSLLIVEWVADASRQNELVNLGGAIFVAPFIVFSMAAGRVADRFGKPRVILWTKFWELLVVTAAIGSLGLRSIPLMLTTLLLLSLQATFFSPAKYGVVPELMPEEKLSYANGVLNLGTFAGILLGTVAATFLATHLFWAKVFLLIASALGLGAAWFMTPLPAAKPDMPMSWNPIKEFLKNWLVIRTDRPLKLGVLAVNYFWFMGAALQLNLVLYASQMMHLGPWPTGQLIMAVAVGVGLGSYLCGKLSHGKVELGLVPLGSLLMSVFVMDLLWAHHSFARTAFDLFMVGVGGGFYDIPLMALIQWRSPTEDRGRIQATVNLLSFVAILGATIAMAFLGSVLKLNPAQVFFALGASSLIGTFWVYRFVPDAVWRFVSYMLTNIFYRLRVNGSEHVPMKGPALLISNHLSMADGFLVGGALSRLPRFLIWRPYYEARPWHWLLKIMKAIPISDQDPPKEILRSLLAARKELEAGHIVCIFAEGQISRTGNLLEFKKGFEVIVKGLEVPVIPVNLDRVWGSIFSFEHGKVIFKMPRRIPYPVTVTFGAPLRGSGSTLKTSDVRQAVMDLGAEAFAHRLEERDSLPLEFLKTAKRQPRVLAIADSSGKRMSFGQVAAVSQVLAEELQRLVPSPASGHLSPMGERNSSPQMGRGPAAGGGEGNAVGLLLPPSVPGVLTNIAVSLLGWIPINLNYTAGASAVDHAVEKAGIKCILTSRKFLEKTGLPAAEGMLYVEDILPTLSWLSILIKRIRLSVLPIKAAGPRLTTCRGDISQTATIMFSSGSTGVPKGVVLSHSNILSNIVALAQVFDVGPRDRMLGVLPLFHSFGFTATMWFPLIQGFTAVYHSNPLDSKTIGELAERYKATMLLSTPTFLSAYIRRCTPEQFRKLRYVITGAERLRESIAKAFQEKFGVYPLEGYGCTELSPVACANVPDVSMGEIHQTGRKAGTIGHPIPGVSVRVVDPETFAPRPQGEAGLLLVKGPNVMQGYLDEPEKTAAVLRDGWYVTGDIGRIDPDGFIQLVDRLSRFSKIGGEMVPHVLVEEKLHEAAGAADTLFAVIGIPCEKRGEQLVVFHAPLPEALTLEDLLDRLQRSDLPKLWIPARDHFYPIDAIPQLGSGKTDLARLKEMALKSVKG